MTNPTGAVMSSRLTEAANRLWDETEEDWHINYSTSLTEPVCALISIYPDQGSAYPDLKDYIGKFADDPDRDMADAVDYLIKNIQTFKQSDAGRRALQERSKG